MIKNKKVGILTPNCRGAHIFSMNSNNPLNGMLLKPDVPNKTSRVVLFPELTTYFMSDRKC